MRTQEGESVTTQLLLKHMPFLLELEFRTSPCLTEGLAHSNVDIGKLFTERSPPKPHLDLESVGQTDKWPAIALADVHSTHLRRHSIYYSCLWRGHPYHTKLHLLSPMSQNAEPLTQYDYRLQKEIAIMSHQVTYPSCCHRSTPATGTLHNIKAYRLYRSHVHNPK